MVAMADPLDYNAIDDINIITNFQVEPVVATTRSIMLAIDKYFGQEEVTEALAAYAKEKSWMWWKTSPRRRTSTAPPS